MLTRDIGYLEQFKLNELLANLRTKFESPDVFNEDEVKKYLRKAEYSYQKAFKNIPEYLKIPGYLATVSGLKTGHPKKNSKKIKNSALEFDPLRLICVLYEELSKSAPNESKLNSFLEDILLNYGTKRDIVTLHFLETYFTKRGIAVLKDRGILKTINENTYMFQHQELLELILAYHFVSRISRIKDFLTMNKLNINNNSLHRGVLIKILLIYSFSQQENSKKELLDIILEKLAENSAKCRFFLELYGTLILYGKSLTYHDIKYLKDQKIIEDILRRSFSLMGSEFEGIRNWSKIGLEILHTDQNLIDELSFEAKRKIVEALPFLFKDFPKRVFTLLEKLRLDFDENKKSDIRRRCVEAIYLIHRKYGKENTNKYYRTIKKLLNIEINEELGFDEPYTIMAIYEVIFTYYSHDENLKGRLKAQTANYIRKYDSFKEKFLKQKESYTITKEELEGLFEFIEKFFSVEIERLPEFIRANLLKRNNFLIVYFSQEISIR